MRERMRMTGLFTTCLVAGFGLTGCLDQAAQERAEVQETLHKANTDFQKARVGVPVPGTEEFDTKKQALDALAGRLSGIRGGSAGQQGSKSILLVNTMTELASMDMVRAENHERVNASISAQVIGIIQGGLNLNRMLESRQAIDLQTSRSQLSRDMERAETELGQLNEQLAELEGPIADREGQNTRDAEEVNALRKSSDELFRDARERGYASGFNSFKEAIQARRTADRIEYEIAQREIVLDLNLKAEQGYINLNARQINKAIEAISDAQAAIDTHEKTGTEDLRNTVQLIATLRGDLDALLQKLADTTNNELNPLYDSAQEYLEKAAREAQSAAGKAGRNGDANGPDLIGIRAQESLGKLHRAKSRGISNRRKLYELIHQAREVFSEDSVLPKIEELNQQHDDAVEKAKAAYTQAIQLLSQVNNPKAQNEINAFRQSLDLALASLEGHDVSARLNPQTGGAAGDSTAGQPENTADSGHGFSTPESLLDFLKSAKASSNLEAFFGTVHISSEQSRREINAGLAFFDAFADLEKAITRQFQSSDESRQIGQLTSGLSMVISMMIPDLDQAQEMNRTNDRVTLRVTNVLGMEDSLDLIRVNGSWYLDMDDDETDPAEDQQRLDEMAASTRMINQITQQINLGQIATMQQLQSAMQTFFSELGE